jgi:hypothetical protein
MLARIRVGDRRFIAAASGSREARSSAAHLRLASCDLDLTAAYGIEAACPRQRTAAAGFRSTVTEPQLDHVPAMPVSTDPGGKDVR